MYHRGTLVVKRALLVKMEGTALTAMSCAQHHMRSVRQRGIASGAGLAWRGGVARRGRRRAEGVAGCEAGCGGGARRTSLASCELRCGPRERGVAALSPAIARTSSYIWLASMPLVRSCRASCMLGRF